MLAKINRASLSFVICRDGAIFFDTDGAISVQPMMFAVPRRHFESHRGRQLQPEKHESARPVGLKLLPALVSDGERGAAQNAGENGGVFGGLVERDQQRRAADALVFVEDGDLHGVEVKADALVGVSCGDVEDNLGVLEPVWFLQAGDGEIFEVDSWPVGAEAQPENESYDAQKGQKA